ncbi:MAG: RNA polymerase sigma factor [Planctomycetota bacterium]|jgi:RNA polymerase sigma-70 factor (ECF subfamily)
MGQRTSGSESALREALLGAYRYALALTHDEWLANDLLGDACLSVLRAGGPLENAYLLKAVRSRFIDHCRRVGGERPRVVPLNDGACPPARPVQDDNDDTDAATTLDRALAVLRPEEREVLFLHAVAGLTAREIATISDQSRSTVLSLLQRGRSKVRQRMETTVGRGIGYE